MKERSAFQQAEAISNAIIDELRATGSPSLDADQFKRLLSAFRLLAEGLADILDIIYTPETPLSALMQSIHAMTPLPASTRVMLKGSYDITHKEIRLRYPQRWNDTWSRRYREFLLYVSRFIPGKDGATMSNLWFLFQNNSHSRVARALHGTGAKELPALKGLESAARYILDIREQHRAEQDKGKAP